RQVAPRRACTDAMKPCSADSTRFTCSKTRHRRTDCPKLRTCPAATCPRLADSAWWPPCWRASLACWRCADGASTRSKQPRRLASMPPDFNPAYQIPNWGWWIVLYFFLGGVTGGVYFAAAWLDLFGDANDRPAMRLGYLLAFPLIIISAALLVVDLGQPLRFWHMIFQSERFPEPILKPYSPVSLGSAILAVFGLVSFLSFVDEVFAGGRLFHKPGNLFGKVFSTLGALAGLALAGYTGVLLSTTNEPVWGNSPWISAWFLFSGISTGIAVL